MTRDYIDPTTNTTSYQIQTCALILSGFATSSIVGAYLGYNFGLLVANVNYYAPAVNIGNSVGIGVAVMIAFISVMAGVLEVFAVASIVNGASIAKERVIEYYLD